MSELCLHSAERSVAQFTKFVEWFWLTSAPTDGGGLAARLEEKEKERGHLAPRQGAESPAPPFRSTCQILAFPGTQRGCQVRGLVRHTRAG